MENIKNTATNEALYEGEVDVTTEKPILIKPKSKGKAMGARTTGGFATLINSENNGKRFTFVNPLKEKLQIQDTVDISFTANGIAIGKELPENAEMFHIKTSGNKSVIYSSSLVEEITEVFQLDFSSRVSITFTEVEFINDGDYFYAEIKIK